MRHSRRSGSWSGGSNFDLFGAPPGGAHALGEPTVVQPIVVHVPGATPETAIPVASLNETAKAVIEGALAPLWVRGEVSDFKRHRNGHWYFCLRDGTAQIKCVVWSRSQRGMPASPDDGMEVTAYGQLTIYAARGEMQLSVTQLAATGDGLWRKALEETRARLERDGLLASDRKRALPRAPRCVGVVTSPDGAALRDVVAVIHRRAPHVAITLCGASVQGPSAPREIADAIDRICRWGRMDVLIVGRGGGAREDLWAFNEEMVARAISRATVPVISAVGHEIDITIADLIADHRAATPSAAAEAAVPLREDLIDDLRVRSAQLRQAVEERIAGARRELADTTRSLVQRARLDIERRRARVSACAGRLDALSPLATLARGYAVARDPQTRHTLSSVADFSPTTIFSLTVSDGEIRARPTED